MTCVTGGVGFYAAFYGEESSVGCEHALCFGEALLDAGPVMDGGEGPDHVGFAVADGEVFG